jgi:hypothetical protein
MAAICDFSTDPEQAQAGFKIICTTIGTDAVVLAEYEGCDIRLIRGAAVRGADGQYEFSVMIRRQSVQVKHCENYEANNTDAFTHQVDIEDRLSINGQINLTLGALEGGLDDMISVTAEVNTNPENGVDQVPCLHVHYNDNELAFSAFKLNDKIALRLEAGVTITEVDSPEGKLYIFE